MTETKITKRIVWVGTMAALAVSACLISLIAAAAQNTQSSERKTVAQQCLACHGSFDELAKKTEDYRAPSGETTTPHRYVPHSEKTDIPECTECHMPHPVPLEDKSKVVKPQNINYCFSCHHANNLQPCKSCH